MKTTLSVNGPPPRRPVLRSDATRPGCSFFVRESVMLNLFQHLDPENRCTLKSKNPLVADENHVVRQRATVKKTGSSFRRYASRLFVLGTGSLIKSGIQQMVIRKRLRFRHSDKAPGRNLDALASMVLTKNEEQILALERITDSPGERRTAQRSTAFFALTNPPTSDPQPRFSIRPDPEQERFRMTK